MAQIKKHCQIGERVNISGKIGFLISQDPFKVRFEDGSEQFVEANQLNYEIPETYLKECPFCKSANVLPVFKEQFGGNKPQQCMKCGERFANDILSERRLL